jgi:transposase
MMARCILSVYAVWLSLLRRSVMSMPAPLHAAVPEETVRVARAAFPKGNVFMRMHDELGPLYRNPQLTALFSHTG